MSAVRRKYRMGIWKGIASTLPAGRGGEELSQAEVAQQRKMGRFARSAARGHAMVLADVAEIDDRLLQSGVSQYPQEVGELRVVALPDRVLAEFYL